MTQSEQGKELAGKVALVTGGGTGIGEGIARILVQAGAAVEVSGRRLEMLEAVVESLQAEGAQALAVPGDVASPQDALPFSLPPSRSHPARRLPLYPPHPPSPSRGIRPAEGEATGKQVTVVGEDPEPLLLLAGNHGLRPGPGLAPHRIFDPDQRFAGLARRHIR